MVQRLNFVAQVEAVPNVLGSYVHFSDYRLLVEQVNDLKQLLSAKDGKREEDGALVRDGRTYRGVCRILGVDNDILGYVGRLKTQPKPEPVYRTSPKDSKGYEYQIRGKDIWWRTAQTPSFIKHFVSTAEFLETLAVNGEYGRLRIVCELAANPTE